MFSKVKPWRCEKYLRFVRSLPCCICGNPDSVAHHGIAIGFSGTMAGKISDIACMPVCVTHHDEIHRNVHQHDQQFYILQTIIKAANSGKLKFID